MTYNPNLLTNVSNSNFVIHTDNYLLTNLNSVRTYQEGRICNLIIYAQTVVVRGTINLEGADIFILCQRLVCEQNSKISSIGKDGKDQEIRANDEENGIFSNEQVGNKGGDITIISEIIEGILDINTKGGNGGKGQDGGKGNDGRPVRNGANGRGFTHDSCGPGEKGPDANNGGNGGTGAVGGNGGNSGNVIFINVDRNTSYEFAVYKTPSTGGEGGKLGSRGLKGEPGKGGRNYVFDPGGGPHDRNSCIPLDSFAPNGNEGRDGVDGEDGKKGNDGQPPVITIYHNSDDEKIAKYVSFTYIDISLRIAEYSYLNSDFIKTTSILLWISRLCKQKSGNHFETVKIQNRQIYNPTVSDNYFLFPYSQISMLPTETDWGNIKIRIANLVYQLSLGLDYFGNPSNFVTLTNLAALERRWDSFYRISKDIEKYYKEFRLNEEINSQSELLVTENIKHHEEIILNKKEVLNVYINDINKLPTEIREITKSIDFSYRRLLQAETNFSNAIRHKYGACTVENIAKTINTFVTIYRAVNGDVSAILSSINNIEDLYSHRLSNGLVEDEAAVYRVYNTGVEAGNIVTRITNIYNTIREQNQETQSLIAMKKEEMVKVLEEHQDLAQAEEFKHEMENYLNLVDTKNQKRLLLTQFLLEYSNLKANIEKEESELNKIKSSLTELINSKASSEIKNYFENTYKNTLQALISFIYLESKALQFLSLKNEVRVNFQPDVILLGAAHSKIVNEDFVNYIRNRTSVSVSIDLPENRTIVFNNVNAKQQFERFKDVSSNEDLHIFDFTLNPENASFRANWYEIFAYSIRVKIVGVQTRRNDISFKISHLGNSTFKTSNRELIQFSHIKRDIPIHYDYQGNRFITDVSKNIVGNNPTDNELFYYVSPFANWRIEVSRSENDEIDFSSLSEIQVSFSFYAKSRN